MSFVSLEFIFIFFPLCVAGYYVFPKKFRNAFLLAASLIFYASGEPRRIYILLLSILMNYVFGLLISRDYSDRRIKTAVLMIAVICNAGLLFGYKFLMMRYGLANVTMPLGLSFFTFRTVSYCLDVYWDIVPVNKSLPEVALYISFFPQISMGPVSRYADFMKDIENRGFNAESFHGGIKRIITGLFKKLIVADSLLPVINASFGMEPSLRSVSFAWLGLAAFLIQLYFDFMGYTDIAVGIGALFGFKLPENFNYPYASASITDFWGRWHITLGEWARNYIYVPIFRTCQSRKKPNLTCYILSSLGVWLFLGAWHGLGKSNMLIFIVHGLYNFTLIVCERLVSDRSKARRKKLGLKKKPQTLRMSILSHIYFIVAIIFGQLLFNCSSFIQYGNYVMTLFGIKGNPLIQAETYYYLRQDILPLAAGIVFSIPVLPYVAKRLKNTGGERVIRCLSPVIYTVMFIVSLAFAFTGTYKSFVYFQF